MATSEEQPTSNVAVDEPLCLTTHDFIRMSNGVICDYVGNCDSDILNADIRGQSMENETDTLFRMENLKDIQDPGQ